MARQLHTKQIPVGPYPTLPVGATALNLTETPADVANKEMFVPSGDDLLIAHNTDAGSQTVTLTSVADAQNRTGDITNYSIPAGRISLFRYKKPGWMQSDGRVYFEAASANVKFAVVQL